MKYLLDLLIIDCICLDDAGNLDSLATGQILTDIVIILNFYTSAENPIFYLLSFVTFDTEAI